MAGSSFEAELLKIFPHSTSIMHGRSRSSGRAAKGSAHGRARSKRTRAHGAGHHTRAPIDKLARIDPWKHVGQARGQG